MCVFFWVGHSCSADSHAPKKARQVVQALDKLRTGHDTPHSAPQQFTYHRYLPNCCNWRQAWRMHFATMNFAGNKLKHFASALSNASKIHTLYSYTIYYIDTCNILWQGGQHVTAPLQLSCWHFCKIAKKCWGHSLLLIGGSIDQLIDQCTKHVVCQHMLSRLVIISFLFLAKSAQISCQFLWNSTSSWVYCYFVELLVMRSVSYVLYRWVYVCHSM